MTTRGDIIYRNASVPARLAKGSSGDVLTMGASDPAWSAPAGAATKEFFAPFTRGSGYQRPLVGDYGEWDMGSGGEWCACTFYIPDDFSSMTECVIVYIPVNTDLRFDLYTDYAAIGEGYNANSASSLAFDVFPTANQMTEINIAGLLSSIAANDYVGVHAICDPARTPDSRFLGVRFKYS